MLAVFVLARGGRGNATLVTLQKYAIVRALSPMALTCAAIVVGSGLVSTSLHIDSPADLTTSDWGRTLLAKLAFVALVFAAGWRNWKRNTPLMQSDDAGQLRRGAIAELALMLLVLLVTSSLVARTL
jgi:putative copper export protein